MSEKKTFKNPWRLVLDFGYEFPHWNVFPSGSSSAEEHGAFSQNEWDMEVTFTKKQPKLEIGGTCKFPGPSTRMVIVGFDDEHVWLKDPQNMGACGFLIDLDTVTDVKPWQPA